MSSIGIPSKVIKQHQIEAYYDVLKARSEATDDAYDAAYEEAERKLTFDCLLDAMLDLSDSVKKQALHDAAQAHSTHLFAETYERLLQAQTGKALQEATNCARNLAFYES